MIQKNNVSRRGLQFLEKIRGRFSIALIIFIALIVVAFIAFRIVTEFIWMDTIGFGDVYTTILYSKISLAIAGFLIFFIFTLVTLYWIRRSYLTHFRPEQIPDILTKKKFVFPLLFSGAFIIGLIGSSIVQGIGWEPTLKFLNYTDFGITDPYFNMDVSFYIFVLPFIQLILYILLNLFIFFLILQAVAYSVFQIYRLNRSAQIHMGVTILFIGLLLACIHFLGRYNTLLTDQVNMFQKSVVHGLSYTDKIVNIPAAYTLSIAAIVAAVWIMVALLRGNILLAIRPVILYVGLFILSIVASIVVQNFIVSPNEFVREKPFLEHNLNYTRMAYELDKIKEEENPGDHTLTEEMIKRNELTINNVRLNDSRPLLDIYNQLQTFRTYYKFNDMDIDRYKIDGNYEQVFIGARELSTDDLPDQAKTWVNRKLRYTHGYGVAMSHVNKVTKQGQPEYLMKNVPAEGEFDITRPQIYFGEEPYPNVIVNSKVDEFDYPTGDENATNRYEERSGIPLKGINRFLFALKEGSFRMLVSDQITSESQFLETRNIKERINRVAPFFKYDNDPYIIIRDDGTLSWIIDAYLVAQNYPYSEAHKGSENYIRNSVKVVIDAYTGEVDFYIVDEDDPLLQTYENIFPNLFTKDIPEDIQAHFRYPEVLFKIQASMYGTYHMSNLEVFYNREDYWQFPTEKYFNKDIEMEPYYITMKLPEYEEEEFILMMPYTPRKRQNMIAWMGVRNDGEHYGEMFVYRFPKQKNVYGPQQIENRINQDSYISQQLNLWSQGGSEVIRGNLLVIPIEDTVLYVEPIYIESSNESSLPEVKQVIIAYEDHIVMEENFEKALDKILEYIDPDKGSKKLKEEGKKEETDIDSTPAPILTAEETLREIGQLFEQYREATAEGDWVKAGQMMEQIESLLETLND